MLRPRWEGAALSRLDRQLGAPSQPETHPTPAPFGPAAGGNWVSSSGSVFILFFKLLLLGSFRRRRPSRAEKPRQVPAEVSPAAADGGGGGALSPVCNLCKALCWVTGGISEAFPCAHKAGSSRFLDGPILGQIALPS